MATKTYYFGSGNDGNFGALFDGVAQTAASRTDGWTVAKIAAGNCADFDAGTKQASGTFIAGTSKPSTLVLGTTANAFKTPTALTGTYAGGNWSLAFALRAVVLSAQLGRIYIRVFKSVNADGSGATELTSGNQNSGVNTATLSTTADTMSTITWNSGAITLANEYLFFAVGWWIGQQGGSNTADVVIRTGSTGPAGSRIVTPDFVPASIISVGRESSGSTVRGITVTGGPAVIQVGNIGGPYTINPAGVSTSALAVYDFDSTNRLAQSFKHTQAITVRSVTTSIRKVSATTNDRIRLDLIKDDGSGLRPLEPFALSGQAATILNGDFSSGLANWNSNQGATLALDNTVFDGVAPSLKVTQGTAGVQGGVIQYPFTVLPNTTYMMRSRIIANTGVQVFMWLDIYSDVAQSNYIDGQQNMVQGVGAWRTVDVVFTTPPNALSGDIGVYMENTEAVGHFFNVDNIELFVVDPSSVPLDTWYLPFNSISGSQHDEVWTSTKNPVIPANTLTWLVMRRERYKDSSNYILWYYGDDTPPYTDGSVTRYNISSNTWTVGDSGDLDFQIVASSAGTVVRGITLVPPPVRIGARIATPVTENTVRNDDSYVGIPSGQLTAQPFVAKANALRQVKAWLYKFGTPASSIQVEIQTDSGGNPSGTSLGWSSALPQNNIGLSYAQYTFDGALTALTPGTKYHLVFKVQGAIDGTSSNGYSVGLGSPVQLEGQDAKYYNGVWNTLGSSSLTVKIEYPSTTVVRGLTIVPPTILPIGRATDLITNGNFEQGTTGWYAQNGTTISRSSEQVQRDSYSMKVVSDGSAFGYAQHWPSDLVAGRTYAYSAWVYGTAGKAMQRYVWDDVGAIVPGSQIGFTGSASWQQVTATFTAVKTASHSMNVMNNAPAVGDAWYVDNVSIVALATVRGITLSGTGTAAPVVIGKKAVATTVRGVTLSGTGTVSVTIGKKTTAFIVRGITLVPAPQTITIGRKAAATVVKGVTVSAAGQVVTVVIGKKAVATTVRGVTLGGVGTATPVVIGKKTTATTVFGVTLSGTGTANLVIGRKASATVVKGVTVSAVGAVTVVIGTRAAATTTRGVTISPVGAVTVTIGKRTSATTVLGVTIVSANQNFPVTLAATMTLTPALTRQAKDFRTLAVVMAATPATVRVVSFFRTVAVTTTITPALTRGAKFLRTVSATVTLIPARSFNAAKSLAVTATLVPSLVRKLLAGRTFAATTTLTPVMTNQRVAFRTLPVTVTFTPAISRLLKFFRAPAVTVTLTPTMTRVLTASRIISVTPVLTPVMARKVFAYRTLALSLVVTPTISRNGAGAVTIPLVVTLTPTMNKLMKLSSAQPVSVTFIPVMSRKLAMLKTIPATTVISPALSRQLFLNKTFAVSMTLTSVLSRRLSLYRTFAASALFTPTLAPRVAAGRLLAASTAILASMTKGGAQTRSVNATVTLTPSISFLSGKGRVLNATTTLVPTLKKLVGKNLNAAINFIPNIQRKSTTTLAATVVLVPAQSRQSRFLRIFATVAQLQVGLAVGKKRGISLSVPVPLVATMIAGRVNRIILSASVNFTALLNWLQYHARATVDTLLGSRPSEAVLLSVKSAEESELDTAPVSDEEITALLSAYSEKTELGQVGEDTPSLRSVT